MYSTWISQGMDPANPAVDDLLTMLAEYSEAMPPANCRSVGMSLQLFKHLQSDHTPTPAQQRILHAFASKLPGWTTRKITSTERGRKLVEKPNKLKIMTTIRRYIMGTVVHSVCGCLMSLCVHYSY